MDFHLGWLLRRRRKSDSLWSSRLAVSFLWWGGVFDVSCGSQPCGFGGRFQVLPANGRVRWRQDGGIFWRVLYPALWFRCGLRTTKQGLFWFLLWFFFLLWNPWLLCFFLWFEWFVLPFLVFCSLFFESLVLSPCGLVAMVFVREIWERDQV